MKVTVKLPVEIESHWKRLLAVYGPDAEALAVAAVESLWKKYHKDVEAFEREREREREKILVATKKIKNCKRRVQHEK